MWSACRRSESVGWLYGAGQATEPLQGDLLSRTFDQAKGALPPCARQLVSWRSAALHVSKARGDCAPTLHKS